MSVDMSKIEVGTKVRLRDGSVRKIVRVENRESEFYPFVILFNNGAEFVYTAEGAFYVTGQDDLDIIEILVDKKLYKLTRSDPIMYDTYDAAIVCAESEEEARQIHPDTLEHRYETWCEPEKVVVEFIGFADESVEKGVVLASFNAAG